MRILDTSVLTGMTVQQAETILASTEVKIALQHRFGGDRGTILRLDNDAMINIYDDGRYYIQCDETGALLAMFSAIEKPWDPDSWTPSGQDAILPWFPPRDLQKPRDLKNPPDLKKRFDL